MTLVLHRGGELITLDALKAVPTPVATDTHVPLPHHDLVAMTKYALGYFGHEVVEEHHAIAAEGARYFGLLTLKSPDGLFTDTLGLRNAHDKAYPIGLAYGAKTFVCDNLSFHGDFVIRRKHTANSRRDLPGLVSQLIEPLQDHRAAQSKILIGYQETPVTDQLADQAIMSMYRGGIINLTRIGDVVKQWDEPEYDWGDKTAWRLFNAATFALTGKVTENPSVTADLHRVIDGVCRPVH
jgi:hypothetical protein